MTTTHKPLPAVRVIPDTPESVHEAVAEMEAMPPATSAMETSTASSGPMAGMTTTESRTLSPISDPLLLHPNSNFGRGPRGGDMIQPNNSGNAAAAGGMSGPSYELLSQMQPGGGSHLLQPQSQLMHVHSQPISAAPTHHPPPPSDPDHPMPHMLPIKMEQHPHPLPPPAAHASTSRGGRTPPSTTQQPPTLPPPSHVLSSSSMSFASLMPNIPEQFGHCPKAREGPALGCNYCWNTTDVNGRILRRKTKYHCPECQANLCIVPCFQKYHEAIDKERAAAASSSAAGNQSSVPSS